MPARLRTTSEPAANVNTLKMPCKVTPAAASATKAQKVHDEVIKFEKRELTFQVVHENPVTWKSNHYHCRICGLDFSPKKHNLQTERGVAGNISSAERVKTILCMKRRG
jgi:hypothetical protein